MSWTKFLLLGDLGQQQALHEAQVRLSRLTASRIADRAVDRRQDERLDVLEREVLQLEAAFAGVVQLLRDKGLVAAAELEAAVERQIAAAEKRLDERTKAAAAQAKERASAVVRRKADRRKRGR